MSDSAAERVVPSERFFEIDMRVGRVVECAPVPQARPPAYRMLIDFGELGQHTSSARVTDNYTPAQLIGSLVVAVVNLPARQVGRVRSEVLVVGAYQHGSERVALLRPDGDCSAGDRIG
ncbi:MAG TPA: tRNA-binding protein [Candidatus Dormibacteraeota bacterium]|nr:tRNA-binding protein [Candidatus Dormibacteraeota bacterium]